MTALHCWHCGAPVAQWTEHCPVCRTDLLRRDSATLRFAVVGGAPLPGRRQNLLARHWRGELPLEMSFWGFSVILPFAAFVLAVSVTVALFADQDAEDLFDTLSTGVLTFRGLAWGAALTVLLQPFAVVGTWRAAQRWRRISPRPAWGPAAQVALAFIAALAAYVLANAISEGYFTLRFLD